MGCLCHFFILSTFEKTKITTNYAISGHTIRGLSSVKVKTAATSFDMDNKPIGRVGLAPRVYAGSLCFVVQPPSRTPVRITALNSTM